MSMLLCDAAGSKRSFLEDEGCGWEREKENPLYRKHGTRAQQQHSRQGTGHYVASWVPFPVLHMVPQALQGVIPEVIPDS